MLCGERQWNRKMKTRKSDTKKDEDTQVRHPINSRRCMTAGHPESLGIQQFQKKPKGLCQLPLLRGSGGASLWGRPCTNLFIPNKKIKKTSSQASQTCKNHTTYMLSHTNPKSCTYIDHAHQPFKFMIQPPQKTKTKSIMLIKIMERKMKQIEQNQIC